MKLFNVDSLTKIILFLGFVNLPYFGFSQDGFVNQLMRTSDKMFVVVIVLLIIFAGIAVYLTYLDKKLKRLEDKVDKK
jgi:CcmD family protein